MALTLRTCLSTHSTLTLTWWPLIEGSHDFNRRPLIEGVWPWPHQPITTAGLDLTKYLAYAGQVTSSIATAGLDLTTPWPIQVRSPYPTARAGLDLTKYLAYPGQVISSIATAGLELTTPWPIQVRSPYPTARAGLDLTKYLAYPGQVISSIATAGLELTTPWPIQVRSPYPTARAGLDLTKYLTCPGQVTSPIATACSHKLANRGRFIFLFSNYPYLVSNGTAKPVASYENETWWVVCLGQHSQNGGHSSGAEKLLRVGQRQKQSG